jgi:TonB family protein
MVCSLLILAFIYFYLEERKALNLNENEMLVQKLDTESLCDGDCLGELPKQKSGRPRAEIMQIVNANMPTLGALYRRHLKEKPGFSGKVILKFTIAESGKVTNIEIVSSTTGYAKFDRAVKDNVATWEWEASESGNTTPTIPFNFVE